MKKALKTITGRCRSCGKYFFRTYKTRPPMFCTECADYRKAESNKARQRSWRERRAADQETAANSREQEAARPVAGCGREDFRATSPRGLFADLPEPSRSTRRQRIGLP